MTVTFNYDSDLPQLTARIQSSVIYEGRVPEGSPRPQGKTLHRQGLGPWDRGGGWRFSRGRRGRGSVGVSPARAGWLRRLAGRLRREGPAHGTPPPSGWKVGPSQRGRLVSIKMFLPGEPLQAETLRDFHSFPYLPLRKISRSSYSEMQYGSKPPTENSDPKKKVTRSKIFLIWPVAQRNSILFTWLLSWGIKA